jgi:hypothetical protein
MVSVSPIIVNLDLSRKLKKAGVKQNSQWYWVYMIPSLSVASSFDNKSETKQGKGMWLPQIGILEDGISVSAFTLGEIKVLFADFIKTKLVKEFKNSSFKIDKLKEGYSITYQSLTFIAKTEEDTFAMMFLKFINQYGYKS